MEAGCDEAGRGCLAGPVFAAAVIFPFDYENPQLNDSKKLSEIERYELRTIIESDALAFSVAQSSPAEIDIHNILWASVRTMHKALHLLKTPTEHIIVDGNKFIPFLDIPYTCIIKGDQKYLSIAAASILAKTYRDDYMKELHTKYPVYNWNQNKGYPTKKHRQAIVKFGDCIHHRKSFKLIPDNGL